MSQFRKQTKSYLQPNTRVGLWFNNHLLEGRVTHSDREGFAFIHWDFQAWPIETPEQKKLFHTFLKKLGTDPPGYCKPNQLFLLEEGQNG